MLSFPAYYISVSFKIRFSFKLKAIKQRKINFSYHWIEKKDKDKSCHPYLIFNCKIPISSFASIFYQKPCQCADKAHNYW